MQNNDFIFMEVKKGKKNSNPCVIYSSIVRKESRLKDEKEIDRHFYLSINQSTRKM